jgi:hypothetical protein
MISTGEIFTAANAHHGGQHGRHHLALLTSEREGIGSTNSHRPSGALYLCPRHQTIAARRRQQINFELHTQNRRIRRHQGESSVTAGTIKHGGDDARVQEAVLLREFDTVRQFVSTSPGATSPRVAPSVCISCWRAKLSRTRCSKSGSAGSNFIIKGRKAKVPRASSNAE